MRLNMMKKVLILLITALSFASSIHAEDFDSQNNPEVAANTDSDADKAAASIGIIPGKTVWLKHFENDLPALSRLKVVRGIRAGEGSTLPNSVLVETSGGKLTWIAAEDLNALQEMLSTENFTKKWSKKVVRAIQEKRLLRGMTQEQAICLWWWPMKRNKSVGSWGIHEQWVYYGDRYLYFENGKLTSWQE